LGQYGLLYAQQHADDIEKLVVLNTPVDVKSALRPELAAYKNPISFLRPKPDKPFDAMTYNASGLAYAIQYRDAAAYAAPYEDPSTSASASAAVFECVIRLAHGLLVEKREGICGALSCSWTGSRC
jgi:pimeloyl-ACP methyl ester carboxylesterase